MKTNTLNPDVFLMAADCMDRGQYRFACNAVHYACQLLDEPHMVPYKDAIWEWFQEPGTEFIRHSDGRRVTSPDATDPYRTKSAIIWDKKGEESEPRILALLLLCEIYSE